MSKELDFSKDTAEAQATGTPDTQRNAELQDTDGFDTVAHRKERIEHLRDKAIDMGNQMRMALAAGDIEPPRRDSQAAGVWMDDRKRVARTVFRDATEAFVREAFQIINTEEAQPKLSRDYTDNVHIATITSPCPDALLQEYVSNLDGRHRTIAQTRKRNHANGAHDKRTDVTGLRQFVQLDSPFGVQHNPQAITSGSHVIFDSNAYYDVCELDWSEIYDVIEITTQALDEAGVGFDFESTDEWEL